MASTLTVSQLNRYLASSVKQDIKLKNIAVKGEISNLKAGYRSGHIYFTVKDSEASLRAVMFCSNVERLKFMPRDGMEILALGSVEYYERDGNLQIICTDLAPVGEGAVRAAVEETKRRLEKMGVFKEENKKKLPESPRRIGVITSMSGAVKHDILNVIKRRFPAANVVFSPASVQGAQAEEEICRAISNADKAGCDVLILARGGGSSEDLMTFNSEKVTMAVFNCKTPMISAVGHETDTTLSDYAADMRAPTPSAAAELAVPQTEGISRTVMTYERAISNAFGRVIAEYERYADRQIERLYAATPMNIISGYEERVSEYRVRMKRAAAAYVKRGEQKLSLEYSRLDALDPLAVLGRGYAIVTDSEGKTIKPETAQVGGTIGVKTKDMEMSARILTVSAD